MNRWYVRMDDVGLGASKGEADSIRYERGVARDYPAATVMMPKKTPKGGLLTDAEAAMNKIMPSVASEYW